VFGYFRSSDDCANPNYKVRINYMEKEYQKLAKYLVGTSKALAELAKEIKQDKDLTKESEELLSKIGANLLFNAKAYNFKK